MAMDIVPVRLPKWMIEAIDELVMKGIFVSRAELIRYGIRLVLKKYEKELNNKISRFEAIASRLKIIKENEEE